ncbi:MAG: hypothetical protein ABI954_01705 [Pyrinomonadaceae bacterium]
MRVKILLLLILTSALCAGCPAPCEMSEQEVSTIHVAIAPLVQALENFHVAQGVYPSELNELTPKFVERVPESLGERKFFYSRQSEQSYLLRVASADGSFYSGSCTSSEITDKWQSLNK